MTAGIQEMATVLTVELPSAGRGLASTCTWAIAAIVLAVLIALGWWSTTRDRR